MGGIPKQLLDQNETVDKMFEGKEDTVIEGKTVDVESDDSTKQDIPVEKKEEGVKEPSEIDYKQKFEVNQGMLEAQGKQLKQLITELERATIRNESLQEVLESIGQKEKEDLEANQSKVSLDFEDLPEDVFEEFGDPGLKLVQRTNAISKIARDLLKKNQDLESKLDNLNEGVSDVRATTGRVVEDSFRGRLLNAHSDFDAINEDSRFNQWLEQPDGGYTGLTKKQIAENAWGKNPDLINQMVADYKKEVLGIDLSKKEPESSHNKLADQIVPDAGVVTMTEKNLPKDFKPVSRKEYYDAGTLVNQGRMPMEKFTEIEKNFFKSVAAGLA